MKWKTEKTSLWEGKVAKGRGRRRRRRWEGKWGRKKEKQKEAETGDSKLKYFLDSWRIHSCSSFPGSDYVCLTIFAFFLKPPCYDSAACKERTLIILKRKQKCLLSSINSNNSGIKLYVDCQSQSQLLKPVSHFWRVQSRGSMESATPAPGHSGGSIPTLGFPPEAGDCWPRGRNHPHYTHSAFFLHCWPQMHTTTEY